MIRQFDVFENPSARSKSIIPCVAAMSSHFLDGIPTVLVAPMIRVTPGDQFTRVSFGVAFQSEDLMLSLPEMAPLPRKTLGPILGDLREYEDDIRRALDRVFTGF